MVLIRYFVLLEEYEFVDSERSMMRGMVRGLFEDLEVVVWGLG